jgi:hypothetical protein
MSKWVLFIFSILIFCACQQKSKAKIVLSSPKRPSSDPNLIYDTIPSDYSITLFNDTAYKLHITIFDTGAYDETQANAVLSLKKNQGGKLTVLLKDSIYFSRPFYLQFGDFNNDKIKDLLFFYYDGARANPRYTLYLVDPKSHSLTHVKGFEELTNAELDSTNNIITSIALSGTAHYSFYRIARKNKLINLGHSFEARENDSDTLKYNKAIQKIKKENRVK